MFEKFLNDVVTELAMRTATKIMDELVKSSESSSIKNQAKESKEYLKSNTTINTDNVSLSEENLLAKDREIWETLIVSIFYCYCSYKKYKEERFLNHLIDRLEQYNSIHNPELIKTRNETANSTILQNYDLWMVNFEDVVTRQYCASESNSSYAKELMRNSIVKNYFKNPDTNNYKKFLQHIKNFKGYSKK
ncbi:MAG TPA: hypothetical protein V6D12_21535 [Candidatus Obscuribacterales bacterium]